jgi:hypothetical protein
MLVAVQLSVTGLYLAPVLTKLPGTTSHPPQTIISVPVQIAVSKIRPVGAFVVLVGIQLFVLGLYFPPVFKGKPMKSTPPQMIISLPVHTAIWPLRPVGALVVLVAVQVFVAGLYLPPVFSAPPPQTII